MTSGTLPKEPLFLLQLLDLVTVAEEPLPAGVLRGLCALLAKNTLTNSGSLALWATSLTLLSEAPNPRVLFTLTADDTLGTSLLDLIKSIVGASEAVVDALSMYVTDMFSGLATLSGPPHSVSVSMLLSVLVTILDNTSVLDGTSLPIVTLYNALLGLFEGGSTSSTVKFTLSSDDASLISRMVSSVLAFLNRSTNVSEASMTLLSDTMAAVAAYADEGVFVQMAAASGSAPSPIHAMITWLTSPAIAPVLVSELPLGDDSTSPLCMLLGGQTAPPPAGSKASNAIAALNCQPPPLKRSKSSTSTGSQLKLGGATPKVSPSYSPTASFGHKILLLISSCSNGSHGAAVLEMCINVLSNALTLSSDRLSSPSADVQPRLAVLVQIIRACVKTGEQAIALASAASALIAECAKGAEVSSTAALSQVCARV